MMNIIKIVGAFFLKIFRKENVKMLEAPKDIKKEEKSDFINSLKINITYNQKAKIETLTCFGDGLGIRNSISY